MREFFSTNRDALIERCKVNGGWQPGQAPTQAQLANAMPVLLEQLGRTLEALQAGRGKNRRGISGVNGSSAAALPKCSSSTTLRGSDIAGLGLSVDQVIHSYGDLCQAIMDFAVENDAPLTVAEFRTLNRCLETVIAETVQEFNASRDASVALQHSADENERLGVLVHELRNYVHTAMLAVTAMESRNAPISGATGGVLKRSLASLATQLNQSLSRVKGGDVPSAVATFSVASFISDARDAATLDANGNGCRLSVPEVDPALAVSGNRERLMAALVNLLKNAFKFTHAHTDVTLNTHAEGNSVLIDVKDHCGGLPPSAESRIFRPFVQVGDDKSGLGLGLSIARRSVEADGGTLTVRDVPGTGCVFTIKLPLRTLD